MALLGIYDAPPYFAYPFSDVHDQLDLPELDDEELAYNLESSTTTMLDGLYNIFQHCYKI